MTDHNQPKNEKIITGNDSKLPLHGITEAIHIGASDLPWIDLGEGNQVQILHVDLREGLWVNRTKFVPGFVVQTHYHTGTVFAHTESGSWYYKEYPQYVNTKGSYLFEPAHSVHTLMISEDSDGPAIIVFIIRGANINLDGEGNITSVTDARSVLNAYRQACKDQGKSCDKMLVYGE